MNRIVLFILLCVEFGIANLIMCAMGFDFFCMERYLVLAILVIIDIISSLFVNGNVFYDDFVCFMSNILIQDEEMGEKFDQNIKMIYENKVPSKIKNFLWFLTHGFE